MKVIIVGCGRLGAHLARWLDRESHEVVVIDRNAEAFARLGTEFRGRMVFGTGIDEDILRRAGIHSRHQRRQYQRNGVRNCKTRIQRAAGRRTAVRPSA